MDYLSFTSKVVKPSRGHCFSPAANNRSGLRTGNDENGKQGAWCRRQKSITRAEASNSLEWNLQEVKITHILHMGPVLRNNRWALKPSPLFSLPPCGQGSTEGWLQLVDLFAGCVCYDYFMAQSGVTSPSKLVRLCQSCYMLQHDLVTNLNVKDDKQRVDSAHAVFSWWFPLGTQSLLLSPLCYTEPTVHKAGLCAAARCFH